MNIRGEFLCIHTIKNMFSLKYDIKKGGKINTLHQKWQFNQT